ncbi:hypothetical protein P9869_16710 [Streptomyces ossamyceticus]|nr:hypothetical protein [Streptomyces ossamyceticus]
MSPAFSWAARQSAWVMSSRGRSRLSALRQPGPATMFTSDEDDTRKPCADRVVVVRL